MRVPAYFLLNILLFPAALSAQGTLYTDPLKRFTVQIPEGWTTQDLGERGVSAGGNGLTILITPLAGSGTPQEAVATLVPVVSSRVQNLLELDRQALPIAGQPASWIIFQGTDSAGQAGTIRVLGLRGGGVTAGVIISGARSDYAAGRGTIEATLATLRLGTNPPIVIRSIAPTASPASTTPTVSPAASPPVTIGLEVRDVNEDDVDLLDLDDESGALVEGVEPDSPADEAGIQPNDVILQVDRSAIANAADFERRLGSHKAGDNVELQVARNGREKVVRLRVLQGD